MLRFKLLILIFFISFISQALTGLRKVQYAAVLYRHGDRMPVDCYPTDPYKNQSFWPEPFGQLTNAGKKQHFRLGMYLRQRYAHLLSEFYDPKEIFIQSTDVDRTLMSAEANLAGMFPPIGKEIWDDQVPWQPIPVHTTPENKDEVIAMKRHCPRYETELDTYTASPPYLTKLNKYKGFMDYLSNNTGMEVKDFTDMMLIYSCLNIESLYNFTLPAWTKNVYPEPLKKAAGISFSVSAATPRMARLIAGPLVQQIVRAMTEVMRGHSPIRLMMYSGHDFTVGTVLTALGLFDGVCPQYTATVFFELTQEKNTTHGKAEWYVRVLYRNTVEIVEPVPLAVPGCGKRCPFHQFVRVYEHLITVDWERECSMKPLYKRKEALYLAALLLALYAALTLFWTKRTKKTPHTHEKSKLPLITVDCKYPITAADFEQQVFSTPADKLCSPGTSANELQLFGTPADKLCSPGTSANKLQLFGTPADKLCSPGTSANKLQMFGTPADKLCSPGTSANKLQLFGTPADKLCSPGTSANKLQLFGTPADKLCSPGTSANKLQLFGTPADKLCSPGTSANKLQLFGTPADKLCSPGTSANKLQLFGTPADKLEVYGTPEDNVQLYGPTEHLYNMNLPWSARQPYAT